MRSYGAGKQFMREFVHANFVNSADFHGCAHELYSLTGESSNKKQTVLCGKIVYFVFQNSLFSSFISLR